MKKVTVCICVAVALILAACDQNKKMGPGNSPTEVSESGLVDVKLAELASTKDGVCGMDVEEGSIADTASYEGKLYGFCSKDCKAEFVKNPQQYLSQK